MWKMHFFLDDSICFSLFSVRFIDFFCHVITDWIKYNNRFHFPFFIFFFF